MFSRYSVVTLFLVLGHFHCTMVKMGGRWCPEQPTARQLYGCQCNLVGRPCMEANTVCSRNKGGIPYIGICACAAGSVRDGGSCRQSPVASVMLPNKFQVQAHGNPTEVAPPPSNPPMDDVQEDEPLPFSVRLNTNFDFHTCVKDGTLFATIKAIVTGRTRLLKWTVNLLFDDIAAKNLGQPPYNPELNVWPLVAVKDEDKAKTQYDIMVANQAKYYNKGMSVMQCYTLTATDAADPKMTSTTDAFCIEFFSTFDEKRNYCRNSWRKYAKCIRDSKYVISEAIKCASFYDVPAEKSPILEAMDV